MRRSFLLGLLLLVPLATALHAQERTDEAEAVRLVLTDGSAVIGTVERETATRVYFRTTSGVAMTVPKDRIQRREELAGRIVDGAYRRLDPNRKRLFFAPTARPLGAGQGYLADYQLFFPFAAVGVGNAISLAGGVSLIPGSPGQLVYAAPKVTLLNSPSASVAVGALAGTPVGGDATAEAYGGLLFGIGTFGDAERSVTVGGGFGFVGADGESATSQPILLVGGELQTSNSIKLISENYVFTEEGATVVLSGGVRFFNDTLAADFALFTSPEFFGDGGFPAFPWVGFAYNFGR